MPITNPYTGEDVFNQQTVLPKDEPSSVSVVNPPVDNTPVSVVNPPVDMSPVTIITPKQASDKVSEITTAHQDILSGMAKQSEIKAQTAAEKSAAEANAKKEAEALKLKQQEIDAKNAAAKTIADAKTQAENAALLKDKGIDSSNSDFWVSNPNYQKNLDALKVGTYVKSEPGATGTTPPPSQPTPSYPVQTEDEKKAAALETQQQDISDKLMEMESGTHPLTTEEQAQIESVKQAYQAMIKEQQLANKNYEAGVTIAGIRAGRNRYAMEMEMGNIQTAVNEGLKKVQDIKEKMNKAVIDLTDAIKDKDYEKMTKQYERITSQKKEKTDAIAATAKKVAEEAKAAQEKRKDDLEMQKLEQEVSKNKIDRITDLAMTNLTGGADDAKMLKELADYQGIDVNELMNAVAVRQQALAKENKATGDIGQYEEALNKGYIPKGTTLAEFRKSMTEEKPSATIQEYEYAKKNGYTGSFIDYQAAQKSASEATTTQKEYEYAKANGFAGDFSDWKNLANYQKSNATSANTNANLDEALKLVQEIGNPATPGFSHAVGSNILFGLGKNIPGTESAGFIGKIDRLKALLTVDNLKYMRGLGAMSEREFSNMQNLATTLKPSLSESEFVKEANRVQSTLMRSKDKMTIIDMYKSGTTMPDIIKSLSNNGYSPEDIKSYLDEIEASGGFKSVGGDTNKATGKVSSVPDNTKGGQCGRFVNKLTGLGVGDSYQSKMSKMDPNIKYPEPGMVFTMPYGTTGHVGFIVDIKDGMATVKDSNYSLDEKVKTHQIPIAKMTGFRRV